MENEASLIARLPETKGDEKRELLLRLCEFQSQEADAFWSVRMARSVKHYLPYLCFSRCDAVSDMAADRLEETVRLLLVPETQYMTEMTEQLWAALALSVFKTSPQMVDVLRLIGENADVLSPMTLDMRALVNSHTLPPFLRRMASLTLAHGCETRFLPLLNDLLICTLVRSEGRFHETICTLASAYPKAYARAGFFAAFVKDTAQAFDTYADPAYLDAVLHTLAGLEIRSETGICELYTPLWFYGVRNAIWQRKYELPRPDLRWISFLSQTYPYADEAALRTVSAFLFQFTEVEGALRDQIQDYFFHTATVDTTETNLVGFMRCGGYDRANELIQGICENICAGRNNYHALFTVFDLLDLKRPEKLRLLAEAREFIESTDHRESWYAQRNHFLHAVKLYQSGKDFDFD